MGGRAGRGARSPSPHGGVEERGPPASPSPRGRRRGESGRKKPFREERRGAGSVFGRARGHARVRVPSLPSQVQITSVSTSVPRSLPPVPPPPPPPTSLSQPPPLLRPPLPTAPTLLRQPPPLQQGRFLQPRLAPNQPPPPLIRPALAASRHSARPGPQPPPTLIGAPLEPPAPSL